MSGCKYLDSVGLDEVHVERRGVGEDFAASLHRTQDIGPHFSQLRYRGFNDLPGLNRRLVAAFRTAAARLTRCGSGHVGVLFSTRAASRAPFSSFLPHFYFRVRLATNALRHHSLATAFGFHLNDLYFRVCICYLINCYYYIFNQKVQFFIFSILYFLSIIKKQNKTTTEVICTELLFKNI